MPGIGRQKKAKPRNKAPKGPPSASQKPPNTKLTLRLPPLSTTTVQEVAPTVSPSTPEPASLPLDDDDIYMSEHEVPYVPSPRQQLVNQFWDEHGPGTPHAEKEDSGLELFPNEATSHPKNIEALVPGGKRKASAHSSERASSVNADSDDSNSDLSIQAAVSNLKARKRRKELSKVEETDEELDKVVPKRKQIRKSSKKARTSGDSEEEDFYKNSM